MNRTESHDLVDDLLDSRLIIKDGQGDRTTLRVDPLLRGIILERLNEQHGLCERSIEGYSEMLPQGILSGRLDSFALAEEQVPQDLVLLITTLRRLI